MRKLSLKDILLTKKLKSKTKINFLVFVSTVLIILSLFNVFFFYKHQIELLNSSPVKGIQDDTQKKLDYWYEIVNQHPDYIIAWIEIAQIEYKRGNVSAYEYAMDAAEEIDPNFDYLTKVKRELSF